MSEKPLRIGVFGGTFDPIHNGHIAAALKAKEGCGLDLVLMMVASAPWQKVTDPDRRQIADADVRFESVVAAIKDIPALEASDMEIKRGGLTYTVQTLRDLKKEFPAPAGLFLIVGTDIVSRLSEWKEIEEVARLADLVIVGRPGEAESTVESVDFWPAHKVHLVESSDLELSGTTIWDRFAAGEPVWDSIPPGAYEVYSSHGLLPPKPSIGLE